MNHPLARAIRGAGLDPITVAARLGVDPKTVNRWLAGRIPYPRHRAALVTLTGWTERDLWPDLARPNETQTTAQEVRVAYPHRSAVPAEAWRRLFANAQHEIGVLAYSALFLAEDAEAQDLLRYKARSGVRIRVLLGDPEGRHVGQRGIDEGIGSVMAARIRNAIVLMGRLWEEPNVRLRLHDTVLYNSIYRGDDELLVNTHVYGFPASRVPVLHLYRISDDGLAATYLDSFERVWTASRPVPQPAVLRAEMLPAPSRT
jgi:hypothetical protein